MLDGVPRDFVLHLEVSNGPGKTLSKAATVVELRGMDGVFAAWNQTLCLSLQSPVLRLAVVARNGTSKALVVSEGGFGL